MINVVSVALGSVVLLLAASGCDTSGASAVPVTEIPAELRLPHEGAWQRMGPGGSLSPLPGVCIDPPPRLADVSPTDGRGIHDGGADGPWTEALGVWADSEDAAEAVNDWLDELALCGTRGPQSHTGYLVEWTVAPAAIDGADEAWTAYQRNLEPNVPPEERVDPYYLAARVGNAVYVEGVLVRGGLDQRSLTTYARSTARSVAAFVPALGIFADP